MEVDERGGVTAPRIVVKGATLALTRRTTFRKAFLAPWHPLVEQCWLYALADAQRMTGVAVHHGVRVITHHHVGVTLPRQNLADFLQRFHRDVSCAINTLLARERYDAPRYVFDKRSSHAMRLLDAEAQASHLVYEHLNPVAAGLVARPEQMPGTVLDFGHWKSGGLWVRRPEVYFEDSRPEELWLSLTPPPLLYQAFDGDLDALVHHMRRLSDEGVRAIRDARRRAPIGAAKVRRIHPWNEPKTMAEPGGRPVPTFKVGARGLVGRRQECAASTEVRGWRGEYAEARDAFLAGQSAIFPHGTYAMCATWGADAAEPHPDASVARPGPLLDEVKAELEDGCGDAESGRMRVLEEVRAAWRDEAADVVAVDGLDFDDRARGAVGSTSSGHPANRSAGGPAEAPEERRAADVRHRFDRDRDETGMHPRRLIIVRDRREAGRREKRGRSDPPS